MKLTITITRGDMSPDAFAILRCCLNLGGDCSMTPDSVVFERLSDERRYRPPMMREAGTEEYVRYKIGCLHDALREVLPEAEKDLQCEITVTRSDG